MKVCFRNNEIPISDIRTKFDTKGLVMAMEVTTALNWFNGLYCEIVYKYIIIGCLP